MLFTIIKFIAIFYVVSWIINLLTGRRGTDNFSSQQQTGQNSQEVFEDALLKVLAAAMQADGRVTQSELAVVRQVLVAQFGEEKAKEQLLKLRDLLKSNYDNLTAAKRIGQMVSYTGRLQIVEILCQIAEADGIITESEKQTILNMAYFMGLSTYDIHRLVDRLRVNGGDRGNYYGGSGYGGYSSSQTSANSVAKAYETLGIKSDATNEELKTTYRNLVKKYHPDRYATQSQEAQAEAAEKFKEVQDAYEKIKLARGL